MKYLSLSTVENSFKHSVVKTSIEFWTLLGVLQSIDGDLKPGITYKFMMANTASFLGKTFTLSDTYKEISDCEEWYAKFGGQWTKEINTFIKQGKVVNIYELAIWALRKEEFEDGADINTVLQVFANRFHFSLETLMNLFSHDIVICEFEEKLYSDINLKDFIKRNYSQDNDFENLRPDGRLIQNAADIVQAGAFVKPFFNKLYNNRCLIITTFNIDLVYAADFQKGNSHSNIPLQQIFYGAPGTGKSFTIEKDTDENNRIRTTFHPDYDYATFVGAYKPTMEEAEVRVVPVVLDNGTSFKQNEGTYKESRIVYKFIPQAFIKAYVEAWKRYTDAECTDKDFYLVIEEINRGNCAQIFGDLFQLLDRTNVGFSSYAVETESDLQHFLTTDEDYKFDIVLTEDIKNDNGKVIATAENVMSGKVLVLPPNLHIWATMNTSDQSLFPIDSAFKRRWDWKYVPIKYDNTEWEVVLSNKEKCKWTDLQQKLNDLIYDATESEDKMLGDWFVKAGSNNEINEEQLVGKIIFYLWNDVAKVDAGSLFDLEVEKNGRTRKVIFSDFYNIDGKVNPDIVREWLKNIKVLKDETIEDEKTNEPEQ